MDLAATEPLRRESFISRVHRMKELEEKVKAFKKRNPNKELPPHIKKMDVMAKTMRRSYGKKS